MPPSLPFHISSPSGLPIKLRRKFQAQAAVQASSSPLSSYEPVLSAVTIIPNKQRFVLPRPISLGLATPPPSSPSPAMSCSADVAPLPSRLYVKDGEPVVVGRMYRPASFSSMSSHLASPCTTRYLCFTLPHGKSEISRRHVIFERVKAGVRIKVLGINGINIGGKLIRKGKELVVNDLEDVEVDFYAGKVVLCSLPEEMVNPPEVEQLPHGANDNIFDNEGDLEYPSSATRFTSCTTDATDVADASRGAGVDQPRIESTSPIFQTLPSPPTSHYPSSLPPSSPVISFLLNSSVGSSPLSSVPEDVDMLNGLSDEADAESAVDDDEDDEMEDEDEDEDDENSDDEGSAEAPLADEQTPSQSPTPSDYSQNARSPVAGPEANRKRRQASSPPVSPSAQKRARLALPDQALRDAVLPHLVTSLALSTTATTTVSTVLADVLEQPSLSTFGPDEVRDACRALLEGGEGGMFGCGIRRGQDASGKPLENVYFYNAQNDPDKQRAQQLGDLGVGRRVRGTQLSNKQYYWKKVGKPRR